MRLEQKEAEVLGFLMDHHGSSCSKQKIQEAVWIDQQVSPTVVKRYISSLRKKLLHAMSCEEKFRLLFLQQLKTVMNGKDIFNLTFSVKGMDRLRFSDRSFCILKVTNEQDQWKVYYNNRSGSCIVAEKE